MIMSGPPGTLSGVIEMVAVDEIVPLRHAVLRPRLPRTAAIYPEDALPDVFHLAERRDGRIVSCVTFFPEPLDGAPAWRLRGMATVPEMRGHGIGGALLEAGVAEVAGRGGRRVWCNGRTGALAFYQRHGFTARGEEFDVPPVGPHYLLVRELTG
jgi:GNAT superfamily N-acetyltransferase